MSDASGDARGSRADCLVKNTRVRAAALGLGQVRASRVRPALRREWAGWTLCSGPPTPAARSHRVRPGKPDGMGQSPVHVSPARPTPERCGRNPPTGLGPPPANARFQGGSSRAPATVISSHQRAGTFGVSAKKYNIQSSGECPPHLWVRGIRRSGA